MIIFLFRVFKINVIIKVSFVELMRVIMRMSLSCGLFGELGMVVVEIFWFIVLSELDLVVMIDFFDFFKRFL